jgi:hypothetical protein
MPAGVKVPDRERTSKLVAAHVIPVPRPLAIPHVRSVIGHVRVIPNVSILPQSPRRPQRKTRYSLGIQEQQIFRVGTLFPSLPEERAHRVWLCDLGDLCGEKSG